MIKIQVLGTGMIPRDLGIAPRKEPFYADRDIIYTILSTPGLRINYLHPEDGRLLPLTRENMKKVLDKFKNVTYDKPTATTPARPHVPEAPKKEESKPEEKKVEAPPTPPTPPKQETPPAPPVNPQPKNETKVEAPKKEESKPEEKKVEEKKDEKADKPTSGGLKPVTAPEKK